MIKVFFAICCFLCFQNDKEVRAWSENYKLTWVDFKGKANYNVGSAAVTTSGISFGYSVKVKNNNVVSFTTEVFANFYPEKSWYKKDLANNHILKHEQLHFDITELYARKFRQQIELLEPDNEIKDTLKTLNKLINEELKALQNLFDEYSNHSINKEEELKWQLFIKEELAKLSQYKSVD